MVFLTSKDQDHQTSLEMIKKYNHLNTPAIKIRLSLIL
jgi:hypothetical protein